MFLRFRHINLANEVLNEPIESINASYRSLTNDRYTSWVHLTNQGVVLE